MPITLNRAFQIVAALRDSKPKGRVCTLGVQNFMGERGDFDVFCADLDLPTNANCCIFTSLGFTSVEAIDVSQFEGCDHIFDLNSDKLPDVLNGQFDVVFTGGTLEHVFDQRAALKNVFYLLKVGGRILHTGPTNGWLDHGFYQFCPTFFTDYYSANRFGLLDFQMELRDAKKPGVKILLYVPGMYDGVPNGSITGVWNYFIVVVKTAASDWSVIPQQSAYSNLHEDLDSGGPRPRLLGGFPYRLIAGKKIAIPVSEIVFPEPIKSEGKAWTVQLPELAHLSNETPFRFSCLYLEYNGKMLGPANALYVTVANIGDGAFTHWGDNVYFSMPEGIEPDWGKLKLYLDMEATQEL